MIISGYEFRNEKPFSNVYFTGIVRDKLRRKMSKQLGNSPDAIKLIEEYGADSVRVGLMLSSAAGNDLLFDESLCQQGKNFTNKLWNALKLINGWEVDEKKSQPVENKLAINWYNNKFNKTLDLIDKNFNRSNKIEINRFKGLGEMMPSQLKETTMIPGNRTLLRVMIPENKKNITQKTISNLMGNKPELRFEFIREKANLSNNLVS